METALKIASLVGVPSIISGLFALLVAKMLKKRDKKQAEIIEQNQVMEAQNKAIMLGVQAFLRDRLLQGYRHYIEKAGQTMMTARTWKIYTHNITHSARTVLWTTCADNSGIFRAIPNN